MPESLAVKQVGCVFPGKCCDTVLVICCAMLCMYKRWSLPCVHARATCASFVFAPSNSFTHLLYSTCKQVSGWRITRLCLCLFAHCHSCCPLCSLTCLCLGALTFTLCARLSPRHIITMWHRITEMAQSWRVRALLIILKKGSRAFQHGRQSPKDENKPWCLDYKCCARWRRG